ncbi:type IX secretion system protein PorG [Kaistella montana]|uniref:DUF6089 family protein n=1 Tax=Kaistella montana TaxID=1849733 RepID=A0ABW5K906_9FLAO|nr:DUF6089 family protein [Kaistella montana]MCQ4035619.1 DUF6089 family protein [Kaistella montana]
MNIDVQSFMQKKIIYCLFTLFLMSVSFKGQRHEIGVKFGMSNLVGDIGRTNYILQKPFRNRSDYGIPFYGGVLYRMNFNPYQTIRFNLGYSHIQFADGGAKEQYRRNRKLSGTNSVFEADVIFEYNFFPVNDEQKNLLSPYVFGGVGAMLMNVEKLVVVHDFNRFGGNAIAPTNNQDFVTTPTYENGNKMTMAIPFGAGLKYKFNYNWALFGEIMFRPTFSDSVDYSVIDDKNVKVTYNKEIPVAGGTKSILQESPYLQVAEQRVADFLQNRQIGNINSKDWVNSVTLGLSYSFGRPPCYCEQ